MDGPRKREPLNWETYGYPATANHGETTSEVEARPLKGERRILGEGIDLALVLFRFDPRPCSAWLLVGVGDDVRHHRREPI